MDLTALAICLIMGFTEPDSYKEALETVKSGGVAYLVVGIDSGTEFLEGYKMKTTGVVLKRGDILKCYSENGTPSMSLFEKKQLQVKVQNPPILPRLMNPPIIPNFNPFSTCPGGNCPR